MRIGILTFHASLNYGGLLQCWALRTALEGLGHEAVVIDRWITPDNWHLERNYGRLPRLRRIHIRIRAFLGLGEDRFLRRIRRCKRFIRNRLRPTPYHFYDWRDAPRDLGVDRIVVGSDILWHCGTFGDPKPYLLFDAPPVPAVAYAASFGMKGIPRFLSDKRTEEEARPVYRKGLARFSAVSCREADGVRICESLGFRAKHVVDPVLLLEEKDWREAYRLRKRPEAGGGRLVCYFLKENVAKALPHLAAFARERGCRVDLFVHDTPRKEDYLPIPVTPKAALRWLRGTLRRLGPVRIRESAGPVQFLRSVAAARWVVTDSFHGLLFSAIFGRNVRVTAPSTENRRELFVRIEDFASHFDGPVVSPDLPDALRSLSEDPAPTVDGAWLSGWRDESLAFLRRALEEAGGPQ